MSGRWIGAVLLIVIAGLVAGLTHFVAVLILPEVASKDAFSLLSARGAMNRMVLYPASRPGDSLIPFRDPSTVQGVCFFDVGKAPVRVKTKIEEGRLLTLSFRTPEGKIFYSMTDRAALRDAIDIRLATDAQLKAIAADEDEDTGLPSELRLRAPQQKGLVVATALITRPNEAQDAEARIKAISCAAEPLPQPQG